MSYLLKNNRKERTTSKQVIVVLMILVLAGIFYFFAPRFVNDALFTAAMPVWEAQNYVTGQFTKLWNSLQDKERLSKENFELKAKLEESKISLQSLDVLKNENRSLKNLLGRRSDEKRILATVLSNPNHSLYDTLILDLGENQGAILGDRVVSGDFVIGTLREVYANHSKATLLSSPGEISSVRIGESLIETEAVGRGGGNMISKLPKEVAINKGDTVRIPGLNPKFFGLVENVDKTETSSFQFIMLRLPVNIYNLEWVEIIK